MTTPLNTVLTYPTVDSALSYFEIRGVKSGINNAYSTGPVYDGGQYYPPMSIITGCDGSFSTDTTVRNLTGTFPGGAPITTYYLNVGDTVNSVGNPCTISGLLTTDSFGLQSYSGPVGTYPITFNLGQRDYLVESDSLTDTFKGDASFIRGSATVSNGTWGTDLTSGDFIKADYYQQFYKIDHTTSATSLLLTSPFMGDTSHSTYTAKKWAIAQTKIQYARNDITFDDKAGRWKYDATTGCDMTTALYLSPLVDGIDLAFTKSIVQNAPDIMDIAVVTDKVLSQQTQYATFQYSLPKVPNPENSFSLKINDVPKVFGRDYVLNYSQNPTYSPPPPPAQRQVVNVMFLQGVDGTPSTALTETGYISITDKVGTSITEILPSSEHLKIGGVDQTTYKDYILEPNSGAIDAIDSPVNEAIVKYVATNYSNQVDHGFSITLNGIPQKISYPAEQTDDVLFQFDFGRLKPVSQDHPGPDDTYEVNYMAESTTQNQVQQIKVDTTAFQTTLFPIKQGSIFLQKNSTYLDEDVDYAVSYLTGWVFFADKLVPGNSIDITYTPLSKQVNNISYADGTSYCTVLDSRLQVKSTNFQFTLINTRLDPANINIARIFNDTKDKDYSLAGLTTANKVIQLASDATNNSIGLGLTDVVLIDYTFPSETVEYAPVVQNLMQLKQGASFFYFEGIDLTSQIVPNTIISAKIPDAATQYYFIVNSVSYDIIGTKITLKSPIPADLVNPLIFIADDAVAFLTLPYLASPVVSGATTISFANVNIVNLFRTKMLIRIKNDIYQIISATYNAISKTTVVSITSEAIMDYTNTADLLSIQYSDIPVYNAGDTIIYPRETVITLMKQPVFIMNNTGNRILQVSSDASNLTVDGVAYSYSSNPYVSDMSTALASAHIDGLTLTTYVPQWQSDKIVSGQTLSVYTNSNTLLTASDALRYRYDNVGSFTDSTSFSISISGTVILTNPLSRLDRYALDYMGRRYLDNNQVEYSVKYFVTLPAKSKVTASFQYDNLDQFYIQVLDRKNFFENITIPRMQNEAVQLNGNVGQGGQVIGDEGAQNSSGGISGDEYRRKDAEIECRIFKNVYDFFENRLEAFGNEMDAATGIRLFNNDGYFSNDEQDVAFKAVNRIFPFTDYTCMQPVQVNPLTGYFFDTRMIFRKNYSDIHNVGSHARWTKQLNTGDFIGRTDSTKLYQIATIVSDSSMVLTTPFQEHSSHSYRGDKYTASTGYPLYDDDGYLGPKLIGTESGDFGLYDGAVFDLYLNAYRTDVLYCSYTFKNPTGILAPFLPDVSELSAESVAEMLTANIPGLLVTAESVLDGATTFGYRTALVLRTKDQYNNILIGSSPDNQLLGFNNNDYAYGNRARVDHAPETFADSTEILDLKEEVTNDLDPILAVPNKLDRAFAPYIGLADDIHDVLIPDEMTVIGSGEIPKIEIEKSSQLVILQDSLPSYANTSQAYLRASLADTSAYAAYAYASSISTDYESKDVDWAWVLDFAEQSQIVHGIASDGTAVPVVSPGDTTVAGQNSFILYHADSVYDRRILNDTIPRLPNIYTPVVVYENNGEVVPGSWAGWDTAYSLTSNYSLINDATFTITPTAVMSIALDIAPDPVINTSATNLGLVWSSTTPFNTAVFPYTSYSSVADLINAINTVPGFIATPGAYDTNYNYTNLAIISDFLPQTIVSGSNSPAFSMYYTLADTTAYYDIDSSAIAISKYQFTDFISKDEFLYASYPTLGDLETGIGGVSDMVVSGLFDPTFLYGYLPTDTGIISRTSPGTYVMIPPTFLFDISFDMHDFSYSTNTTALNIDWISNGVPQGKTYVYGSQNVGDIINDINGGLTSIVATMITPPSTDYAASFIIASGTITPSINLYRGLRDCTVAYQTISDRILDVRLDFDTIRIAYLTDRTDYLNSTREPEIKNDVITEEYLRNPDGSPSDLYVWANNRFNRRQGCYSKLNQIQQQIASNQSALSINQGLM